MLYRDCLRHLVCAAALFLSLTSSAQVKPGIEVLRDRGFREIRGLRVGLLTNPSGVDRNLKSTIDILNEAPEVKLVALFGPEHGVRGNFYAGAHTEDTVDEATGLPVYSLYGNTRKPTQKMLEGLDVVVYDIQDVGVRSYTFISTLGLMMRACAEKGIPVVVLDRPNPLGGLKVEGSYVEDGYFTFVSQYRIPYIYGLTVGELATLINEEALNRGQKGNEPALHCDLTVIPMEGWSRNMLFQDTGLPWILPSPNIPYPQSAINYPSSGLCGELGFVNIGVGYTLPFETFAAEWIDADLLKKRLDSYGLPGVEFRTIHYTPFFGGMKGRSLHGVQFHYTDFETAQVTLTQFYVLQALSELYPERKAFASMPEGIVMFDKVCGTKYVRNTFGRTCRVKDILDFWNKDVRAFKILSSKYLIY